MKRLPLLLSIVCCFVMVSCLEDQDTIRWHKANEAFMEGLKDSTDIFPLEHCDTLISQKEGVELQKMPATGVYYKVIKDADGQRPLSGQSVVVNYTGSFYNGERFDSGYSTFSLGNSSSLIDGFYYALLHMSVGAHWIVYIPYYLGYGSTEYYYSTPRIPAYSTLVFDVELKEIKD